MMEIDESPFVASASSWALGKFLAGIRPVIREDICSWVEHNIDLSFDHTASANGLVKLYPYQREVLAACDDPAVQEITLMWSQRLSKSFCWKAALLKHIHDGNCSGLIVYPSMMMGERMNQDTVLPLLQTLPDVARDLSMRGNRKTDSYHIPSLGSVVYFAGAGTQIISYTANFCVLDESDFVELQQADDEQKNMSQLKALRIRMQSFKERKLIVCSSPTQVGGIVNQNWMRGSRGTWHMRCLHCGGLFPTSKLAYFSDGKEWRGLQWSKDENGEVIVDSIRWICPACGHSHTYDQAQAMNDGGEYVHERPGNMYHRSFQAGALANPALWTWREIAQAQEDAVDGDGKKYLHNTIRGLAYRHQREGDLTISIEEINHARQIEYPPDLSERLSIVVAGVDRQASEIAGGLYYVSVVRGWCEDGSSYLLSCGIDKSLDDVRARVTAQYFGHKVAMALIDNGGFETAEYQPFIESVRPLYWYKGTSGKYLDWKDFKVSENVKKLILCDAVGYQVRLLEELYITADDKRWRLPLKLDEEYFRQLCNVKPSKALKDGNGYDFANWCAYATDRRDYFDAEKMCFAALDVSCTFLPASMFRHGHKPKFWIKRELRRMARLSRQDKKPDDAR